MGKIRVEPRRRRFGRAFAALLLAAAAGCGGMTGAPSTGGESHFLEFCESGCGDGLDCIAGVCTRGCLVDEDACGDLSLSARCTAESIEPGAVAVCDVMCSSDAACRELGAGHRCVGGVCRRGEPMVTPEGSCRVAHRMYPPGEVPAPDGCGVCDCADGVVNCVENSSARPECPDGAPVVPCPLESITSDPIEVRDAYISGHTLTLEVAHSGGCGGHDYALCSGAGVEPVPPRVHLELIHDAHEDTCNASVVQQLRYDLRPIAAGWGPVVDTPFGRYTAESPADCVERIAVAGEQITAMLEDVDASCETASDCRLVSIDTSCTASCGAIANASGAAEIELALSRTDAVICGDPRNGCAALIVPCVPPPPLECVDGRCVFAP